MEPTALGNRMRKAREQAGFSQEAAAARLGLRGPTLSQYETGKRGVDALTLERLARLYGVPLSFFFEEQETSAWEQALREKGAQLSDEGKAGIGRLVQLVKAFEDLYERTQRVPKTAHSPFAPLEDPAPKEAVAAELAGRTRAYYGLGNAPIRDMKAFLEQHGYYVFTVPFGRSENDLSGLIFWHPRLGAIIALNEQQAPVRRPFTMAHEFAHGLYHYNRQAILCRDGLSDPAEKFADSFASHFLIPTPALERMGIDSVSDADEIAGLVRYFGVSPKALQRRLEAERRIKGKIEWKGILWRARALGYPVADYELGKAPLPLQERYPSAYVELVKEALEQGTISRRRAASLLGMSELEFEELMEPSPEEEAERYAIT
ncbi:helix-turn-helix domain-containing protein [Meiothermus taiwanensis]|nr:XRE family transcriptional regulator [Meiothermus taiwanensis]KIQ55303.1 hypothetical protein SY28_04025 [Meiothermus taiwanensis]KZK15606.1 hypothetical protein A3962_09555 [Meiothermus taiwanensis]